MYIISIFTAFKLFESLHFMINHECLEEVAVMIQKMPTTPQAAPAPGIKVALMKLAA